MAANNGLKDVLHSIKVKLYKNNLNNVDGRYIARTDNESSLSVEEVCAALKNRGGFKGNYNDLVEYVKQYNDEVAYQLCDGYAVSNGYFSIYPNIGGSFNSANEPYDRKKNPVNFRFRVLSKLRRLIEFISVEIEGVADTDGFIREFYNCDKNSDTMYAPGDLFVIYGDKIKLAGNDPGVGVFFVPVDNPSAAVKADRTADNIRSKITGLAPRTGYKTNRIEIRTQYTGAINTPLKTPRVIKSHFTLEET
jgi:hypothetical protein